MVKIATCVNGHKIWCYHGNKKRHRLGDYTPDRGAEVPAVCPRCRRPWASIQDVKM